MNKWVAEVQKSLLASEEAAIKELEKQYARALKDINDKVKLFQADIDLLDQALQQEGLDEAAKAVLKSQRQSKIYQQDFQKSLRAQISAILDKMQGDNYSTIDSYLKQCYEDGFIGTMYDIHNQGVPIITPIDQAQAAKAILTDSKVKDGYYKHLGVNVSSLKKKITQEISRGIASGLSYAEISRNLNNASKSGLYNAKRITRTEGHRIQQTSADDARRSAASKGADVVKQWDASLDSRTRPSHRRVDGEIRELDEKFSNGLMFPGEPSGKAAEVINCRCVALTRARWALDEDELKTLQERAEYFGLTKEKAQSFEDYKKKYLKAVAESEKQWGIMYDNTDVDFEIINSKSYQNKFSQITDNPKTNESIYDVAKTMLKHCDGTEHEDIYLLSMDGEIISKVTDSVSKLGVNYTEEFKQALADAAANKTPVIAIHNHPYGTPPSPDDFKKAFENNYTIGIVAGHNGQLYMYSNNGVELSLEDCDKIDDETKTLYRWGADIDRASKDIYNIYGLSYTILEGAE